MKLKFSDEEVIEWFEANKIPVKKSVVYISDRFETKSGTTDPCGVFFPRNLEGYIWFDETSRMFLSYVHEISHGSFFENFKIGRKISKEDRKLYDIETKLFGNVRPPFMIVTEDSEFENKENLRVLRVDDKELKEYNRQRRKVENLFTKNWNLIEGWAVLVSEKITGKNKNITPEYASASAEVRQMESERGFDETVKYLKRY